MLYDMWSSFIHTVYVGLGWFVFLCATQRQTLQGTPSSSCWNSPKSCSSASSSLPSAQDSVSWTPPCPCSQCTRYRRDTTRSMLRLHYCTTTIVAQWTHHHTRGFLYSGTRGLKLKLAWGGDWWHCLLIRGQHFDCCQYAICLCIGRLHVDHTTNFFCKLFVYLICLWEICCNDLL